MGRPRKSIDPEAVKRLAANGNTVMEIAAELDCSHDTLQRRFASAIEKGRSRMKASLRRKQFEIAMTGNPTMLIWLGKQELGQSDKQEVKEQRVEIGYGNLPTPAEFTYAGTTNKPN